MRSNIDADPTRHSADYNKIFRANVLINIFETEHVIETKFDVNPVKNTKGVCSEPNLTGMNWPKTGRRASPNFSSPPSSLNGLFRGRVVLVARPK